MACKNFNSKRMESLANKKDLVKQLDVQSNYVLIRRKDSLANSTFLCVLYKKELVENKRQSPSFSRFLFQKSILKIF